MENKARYTIVGIFLLSFVTLSVIFILWLARYDADEINSKEFRVYSPYSVAGLNKKSIVEYKGLAIGTVENIRINPKNNEQIEIILKIKKPEIIKTDSFATIESQGITGNKHLEIKGGTQNAQALSFNENNFSIIPLQRSFIDTLTSQAGSITDKINIVLSKFNLLLKEENIKNFDELLKNTNSSAKNFDKVMLEMEELINQKVTKSLGEFDQLAKGVNELIKSDIKGILEDLKKTLNSTSNIDKVIEKMEETLNKVDTTLENFNESGGDMIFKTREVQYGPGEKQ